jgi:cyclopropane fatty-acyl-phospholipid synthase-like methyltransferase
MTARPTSPYIAPGFYDRALAQGRHRDIVGGRWDETGRLQMRLLQDAGLQPHHRLLDIGCGSLRLGCRAVPYLDPGHYWGTDASAALMARGHAAELSASDRLPAAQLIEDADFAFPGVPPTIDHAIAWGVFTHLPPEALPPALRNIRHRFPQLQKLLLTVFLAPEDAPGSHRQIDGVVTHPNRPPWHRRQGAVEDEARAAGFTLAWREKWLPRGQRLAVLVPA